PRRGCVRNQTVVTVHAGLARQSAAIQNSVPSLTAYTVALHFIRPHRNSLPSPSPPEYDRGMDENETYEIRQLLIWITALYPVGVAICSVMKLNVPLCANVPWPEVFYGPAITVVSIIMLIQL